MNKPLKYLIIAAPLGLVLLLGAISTPPLPISPQDGYMLYSTNSLPVWGPAPGSSPGTVNNFYATNVTIFDSLTVNTNVTINQNISVSGKATFNNITVTNQLLFTTNAFPLAAGTTWNFTKPYQNIATNNDIQITAISGLTNNLINWSSLEYSNSDSATHFCDLSSLPWHVIGTSSTNKVYVGAGKVAIISAQIRGLSSSNLVTAVEQ